MLSVHILGNNFNISRDTNFISSHVVLDHNLNLGRSFDVLVGDGEGGSVGVENTAIEGTSRSETYTGISVLNWDGDDSDGGSDGVCSRLSTSSYKVTSLLRSCDRRVIKKSEFLYSLTRSELNINVVGRALLQLTGALVAVGNLDLKYFTGGVCDSGYNGVTHIIK